MQLYLESRTLMADPSEGRERARQANLELFAKLGKVCEKLRPGTGGGIELLLTQAYEKGEEAGRRSLEQERDELRERLDDLIACWDVFYKFLPDGEYQGIGQMRAAANQHRAAPPVHKGDS
jgi:hypothetical protein